jgi:hypothetical protein
MILEFAVWRAVPRAGRPERRRSLCDGCYAVDLNLQILPIAVLRHQNCVRAIIAREFAAKETDSRFSAYVENFGEQCWELDAVPPSSPISIRSRADLSAS